MVVAIVFPPILEDGVETMVWMPPCVCPSLEFLQKNQGNQACVVAGDSTPTHLALRKGATHFKEEVLNDVAMAMSNPISIHFKILLQGEMMTLFPYLDIANKNCIVDWTMKKFKLVPGGQEVTQAWIREHMVFMLKYPCLDVIQVCNNGK